MGDILKAEVYKFQFGEGDTLQNIQSSIWEILTFEM